MQDAAIHRPAWKRWSLFLLRWGIAVGGIYWVIANMSLYDRVLVADERDGWPIALRVVTATADTDPQFQVLDLQHQRRTVSKTQLIARTDRQKVIVREIDQLNTYAVLGLKVTADPNRNRWPLVVAPPRNLWQRYWNVHNAPAHLVQPRDVVGDYSVEVPYPLVDRGVLPMLNAAKGWYLFWALIIFPVTFIITSIRWHVLLKVVGIQMARKAFVINMVGAFYNTFMPGSTGGDLAKAYYATKVSPGKRTRAVVSVVVDRAIGLLSLIVLGGAMAGYLAWSARGRSAHEANEMVVKKCLQVAAGSLVILAGTAAALAIFYVRTLRRTSGLEFLMSKLPWQQRLRSAVEAMQDYGRRPMLALFMLIFTFPVHITVILSATLAGKAFDLPLKPWYYWVVVPVVVLAGSIPISPQGAGVMEFFAVLLTRPQGCTVSQAFALTMSIRLVQIFWNLTGGIFVVRGGYHAPTQKEQADDAAAESASIGAAASLVQK